MGAPTKNTGRDAAEYMVSEAMFAEEDTVANLPLILLLIFIFVEIAELEAKADNSPVSSIKHPTHLPTKLSIQASCSAVKIGADSPVPGGYNAVTYTNTARNKQQQQQQQHKQKKTPQTVLW